jgi:beta-galactosidase
VLGVFGQDFYADRPALTRNQFGAGTAWYVAADPEPAFVEGLLAHICSQQDVKPILSTPSEVEVTQRSKGDAIFTFVLNHGAEAQEIELGEAAGHELLSGKDLAGKATIAGREVWIIRRSVE